MISSALRPTIRTLFSGGRSSQIAAFSMTSPKAAIAYVKPNGGKRYAETPLRNEEESRGSYKFKNKRMRKGHGGAQNQILKTQGSNEEVLLEDVTALLKSVDLGREGNTEPGPLPERLDEIEVTIHQISSTGDGLGLQNNSTSDQVYVVPFTAPGDVITAKIFKHFVQEKYSMADIVKIHTPSPHRDDSLVSCKYFASCAGCQFQMLPYDYQLAHKKSIVEKAYRNFSNLPPELIPTIGDTIGSPLQYGYRTKLTPHFDGPPDSRRSDGRNGIIRKFEELPPIGFMKKGSRTTIDIEDCPIGTAAVRIGIKRERKRVAETLDTYHKGATILLREDTKRIPKDEWEVYKDEAVDEETVVEVKSDYVYAKTCVTNANAETTEYIDNFKFVNPAGAFFQNNNSILPVFTQYIREHILPAPSPTNPKITHLIDAYSGSGLFTITLSSLFTTSLGIDISASSIASASNNAKINDLPSSAAKFIAADAAALFSSITTPADETVVMIDPPRKGCDESFLKQLVGYGPQRIVYVSCNVHTQARDVGVLVGGMKGVDGGRGVGEGCYEIETLRGFDFFPQTGHVEGVAVLRRKEGVERKGEERLENGEATNEDEEAKTETNGTS
jgi:tRNA (uracil-5-)-methyltransferase